MLEPMRLKKTSKRSCQQEALDLSLHPDRSADTSYEGDQDQLESTPCTNNESNLDTSMLGDNSAEHQPEPDVIEPTKNKSEENISPEHQRYLDALENICKTWSEVKLFQMKSSVVNFYLNKGSTPKGDNIIPDLTDSPVRVS